MHEPRDWTEAAVELEKLSLTLVELEQWRGETDDTSQICLVTFLEQPNKLAYFAPRAIDSQSIENCLKKCAADSFFRCPSPAVLKKVPGFFSAVMDVTNQCCAAMADAAPTKTMSDEDRLKFAVQVMSGSARMAEHNVDKHFGALKDSVTAPGGMTIRGVHTLRNNGFQGAIMDRVCS